MSEVYKSMSIADPSPIGLDLKQKIGSLLASVGVILMIVTAVNPEMISKPVAATVALSLIFMGIVIFSAQTFLSQPEGIKNNGIWFSSWTGRGLMAWCTGIFITAFYIILYWFPALIGYSESGNTGLVALFDPLSQILKSKPASQWFLYGTLYTLAIISFGIRFIWKYRHNRYQVVRTCSVMFFQLGFAFLLPEFLQKLNYPYHDFKNMWPLNYYFFDEWNIKGFLSSGNVGLLMLLSGVLLIFVGSPILTYLYGKRWYCSWVCGCGGLAETAGDPYRQLSDKSLKAWKIERWLIHSVLAFSILMTIATLYSFFHNNGEGYWLNKISFIILLALLLATYFFLYFKKAEIFRELSTQALKIGAIAGIVTFAIVLIAYFTGQGQAYFIDGYSLRSTYGFLIGAAFSGVVGVGFYPLMGSRVWCRFGCPMAAILGIQQKFFSRFRITTNGGQCISCGNCSTYCEMGIDVRSYAQKGQNIVRASCVGCGVCAAVCPRGVLKLENGSDDIYERTIDIRNNHISM